MTKKNKTSGFSDAPLISHKNKKINPLSKAEEGWLDLIEHSNLDEIRSSKMTKKIVDDKSKK